MTSSESTSTEWTGHDLLDSQGEKIGRIDDVRFGDRTGGLKWLVVKTGLFGAKKILVPAGEVSPSCGEFTVPFSKDHVKKAPALGDQEALTKAEESQLCRYYGLDYVSSPMAPNEGCVEGADQG